MKTLQQALPHLVMAIVVVVAVTILAVDHIISGGEAYGGIVAAGGFTLGGTVASGSISTAATAAVDVSHSASTQTPTPSSMSSTQLPATTPQQHQPTVQAPQTTTPTGSPPA